MTGAYEDTEPYRELSLSLGDRAVLHSGVTEVASLMAGCDLAVSGGGTTLMELCAVGVPSVTHPGSSWEEGYIARMNQAADIPVAHDVAQAVCALESLSDTQARRRLSEAERGLTDGRGAERIARALTELI